MTAVYAISNSEVNQITALAFDSGSGTPVLVTPATPLPTSGASTLGIPLAGQTTIATTNTAVVLGTGALKNGVIIKANISNIASILVGGSTVTTANNGMGNGYPLAPGEGISFAVANLNQIYITGTAGDFVAYAGN